MYTCRYVGVGAVVALKLSPNLRRTEAQKRKITVENPASFYNLDLSKIPLRNPV